MIDAGADQIAGRLGAGEGQHQIRAFGDAGLAQGDAEIILMAGNADLAGDIDQAADADGGIDHDAAEGVGGLVAVALQHIIGQHHRRIEIGQGIVHAVAHRLRHRGCDSPWRSGGPRHGPPGRRNRRRRGWSFPRDRSGPATPRWACCRRPRPKLRVSAEITGRDLHAPPNTRNGNKIPLPADSCLTLNIGIRAAPHKGAQDPSIPKKSADGLTLPALYGENPCRIRQMDRLFRHPGTRALLSHALWRCHVPHGWA